MQNGVGVRVDVARGGRAAAAWSQTSLARVRAPRLGKYLAWWLARLAGVWLHVMQRGAAAAFKNVLKALRGTLTSCLGTLTRSGEAVTTQKK